MPICPHCKAALSRVKGGGIEITAGDHTLTGAYYSCPHCNSILSVGVDPFALKNETVAAIRGRASQ